MELANAEPSIPQNGKIADTRQHHNQTVKAVTVISTLSAQTADVELL